MPKKNKKDNVIISSEELYNLVKAINGSFATSDYLVGKKVTIEDKRGNKVSIDIHDKDNFIINAGGV